MNKNELRTLAGINVITESKHFASTKDVKKELNKMINQITDMEKNVSLGGSFDDFMNNKSLSDMEKSIKKTKDVLLKALKTL